jgi:hypothetical protein
MEIETCDFVSNLRDEAVKNDLYVTGCEERNG